MPTLARQVAAVITSIALFSIQILSSSASAGTLEDIKSKGAVTVGVQADQYPWGYIDTNGANAGHDIDIVTKIGQELGVKVNFTRVLASNRIQMLQAGQVDFLLAAVTMTPERAKIVQFTKPYATNDVTVWGRKDAVIKGNADLHKYKMGVARGTVFVTMLKQASPEATVLNFDDDATTVQALLSRQVDAILGSLTYGLVIDQAGRSKEFERKYKFSDNFHGIVVRSGDKELVTWLNNFIDRHMNDGFIPNNYKKWLLVDLPTLPTKMDGIPFTVE